MEKQVVAGLLFEFPRAAANGIACSCGLAYNHDRGNIKNYPLVDLAKGGRQRLMGEYGSSCRLSAEYEYLCHQCQNIFRLSVSGGSSTEEEAKCPRCGSTDIERLPSWAPIGFALHEGPLQWEYECQHCKNVFKLPVPSSPSQEKEIKCPECGGGHIHRLTPTGGVPMYCG